ncbi:MAG TPA: NTP transferase domain-containing protein [Polyangiales bacterium]
MSAELPILGLFVGGRGRRMGGAHKALLVAPDTQETLAGKLARLAREAALPVVLVGAGESLGSDLEALLRLLDEPAGVGPLGGLAALLQHAGGRPVICVACDMPFVTRDLLEKLAAHPSQAPVLAPRDSQTRKWQPLFARYEPAGVQPALHAALHAGERSFQALLARLPVEELQLTAVEHAALRDWDTPEDVRGTS